MARKKWGLVELLETVDSLDVGWEEKKRGADVKRVEDMHVEGKGEKKGNNAKMAPDWKKETKEVPKEPQSEQK